MRKILDVTDKRTRLRQLLSMMAVGVLTGSGVALLILDAGPTAAGWLTIASALALTAFTATVKQRWDTEYKGHHIRFENSPVLAESLYLDGGLVARGGVGRKMELRAPIRAGEDAGTEIVALVDARSLSFRLRLFVQSPNQASPEAQKSTAHPPPSDSSRPTTTAIPNDTPVSSEATQSGTTTSVFGKVQVAKQVIEFVSAVIGLVGGISTLVGWLS